MLVYDDKTKKENYFSFFKNLEIKSEINTLDRLTFEIPKEYRYLFNVESYLLENKQYYDIKNIEPFYDGYKVECEQNVLEFKEKFNENINFSYKGIKDILDSIVLPLGYNYEIIGTIDKKRVITGDYKSSWEIFLEAIDKFEIEYRIDNYNKVITVGEELGNDKGAYFVDDFNIIDKEISVESFEFATRIIPEGMNGLKINQINNGKDYIEDKTYSDRTITYYWKDERYTNIENLKHDAEEKLKVLSRPKINIELKVKDLSNAEDIYPIDYNIGDFVYLIDKDRKTKEEFRIVSIIKRPYKPFENEISLTNKPIDLVDDKKEIIELTNEMREETRVRFETTDESIEASVETAKRYTEDSFKTYKSEREQTDSRIYEAITESTTYVDPNTGQTKPLIDKQLEIEKTVDGISIQIASNNEVTEKALSDLTSDIESELGDLSSRVDQTVLEINQKFQVQDGKLNSTISTISGIRDEVAGDIAQASADVKHYVEQNYSSITQMDDKIATNISSVTTIVASDVKDYVAQNYSTKTETDNKIASADSKIRTYIQENYSSITQTDSKIQTEVRSVNTTIGEVSSKAQADFAKAYAKADEAYSTATQTSKMIETKVGSSDVYSIVRQEMNSFIVKASQIDFSGKVTITGNLRTIAEGKGININDNSITFNNSTGVKIGEISMDNWGKNLLIQGAQGDNKGGILMNTNQYVNGNLVQSLLLGPWGMDSLYGVKIDSKTLIAQEDLQIGHSSIGNVFHIQATPGGGQVQIQQQNSKLTFVIDYNNKTTFFAQG